MVSAGFISDFELMRVASELTSIQSMYAQDAAIEYISRECGIDRESIDTDDMLSYVPRCEEFSLDGELEPETGSEFGIVSSRRSSPSTLESQVVDNREGRTRSTSVGKRAPVKQAAKKEHRPAAGSRGSVAGNQAVDTGAVINATPAS